MIGKKEYDGSVFFRGNRMRGGKRRGAGRPPIDPALKKIPINVKLPRWLIAWIADRPQSRAVQIETAFRRAHKIKPPKIPDAKEK